MRASRLCGAFLTHSQSSLLARFADHARGLSGTAESLLKLHLDHEKEGVPAGAGKAGANGFDLKQMHRLLEAMQQPQKSLKVVHIAGTKGKGSTAAMLSSILGQSGYKVGTYTSPHIRSINERIAINSRPIGEAEFDGLAERWKPAIMASGAESSTAKLTHFEALTALALAHFSEQQVDVAVVEAGLGGTKDATNVFSSKELLLAIVTNLGLEHQAALGDSLREIAAAKAGICKQHRPLMISTQTNKEAVSYLTESAAEYGSPAVQASEIAQVTAGSMELHAEHARQQFSAQASQPALHELLTFEAHSRLIGDHQASNAQTAVAAAANLSSQGFSKITKGSIKAGVEAAFLPGRFQVSKLGIGEPWMVVDGAHTPASATALVQTLQEAFPNMPLGFIVAMADDKDHAGVLAALRAARPHVVTFMAVPIAGGSKRSAPPGMLVGHWQAASFDEDVPLRCRELMKTNMASAMEASLRELSFANGKAVLCVTGSLHAVAAAQEHTP